MDEDEEKNEDTGSIQAAVKLVLSVLKTHDPYAVSHAFGVARVAVLIGRGMGLEPRRLDRLRRAALVHDIGKIGANREIVRKPGRLTAEEYEQVKKHSKVAYDILRRLPEFADLAEMVLAHHEFFNGEGYPAGLEGEDIPLESRILNVADAFDAMTSPRTYQPALSLDIAFEEINSQAGGQFCPTVVLHFNEVRQALDPDVSGVILSDDDLGIASYRPGPKKMAGERGRDTEADGDGSDVGDEAGVAPDIAPGAAARSRIEAEIEARVGPVSSSAAPSPAHSPAPSRKRAASIERGVSFAKDPNELTGPRPAAEGQAPKSASSVHLPLSETKPGALLAVERVYGDLQFRRRLLELGLVPGAQIKVVRVAPLGDPIEIELRGSSFSLRKEDATHVEVRLLTETEKDFFKPPRSAPPSAPMSRRYRVAVAGNPNSGKTTLFNAMTGSKGKVGNYPGITVDRLTARLTLSDGRPIEVIDVPGTYSLNAHSREEQVAIDEILGRAVSPKPDLVVVVLNAVALERSLYLLFQIQELGYPVVAAANMMDEAWKKRLRIDLDQLSETLSIPLVGVVARTGEGVDELTSLVEQTLYQAAPAHNRWQWTPSDRLLAHVDEVVPAIGDMLGPDASLRSRRAFALWCLMSISPEDELANIPDELRERVARVQTGMDEDGCDLDLEVTKARYQTIDELLESSVSKGDARPERELSQKIDKYLTHPGYGSVAFLAIMALVFSAIFDWAAPIMEGVEWTFGHIGRYVSQGLPPGLVNDLVVDGVIAGVGSVLVFLPQIAILFLFIALLESSGYLSRAAFMIDRVMRKLGLNGKAFVPMLSGFACAVPAIMSTRTLKSRRDRLLTMLVIPLMSCSARLPVYTLVIAALFPANEKIFGPVSLGVAMLFGIYIVSTIFGLVAAGVLGKLVIKGKPQPLLLELPPYRFPNPRDVARVVSERLLDFLKTAGTVILIASIVLWALLAFPKTDAPSQDYDSAIATAKVAGQTQKVESIERLKQSEQMKNSFAGRFGKAIEPALKPLGFDWKIGIGLLGSFAAREVFVSTMGQVYAAGEREDSATLKQALEKQRHEDGSPVYTPLMGFSLLVFFMFALQCVSTVAVLKQESGSWRWSGFALIYMTGLAYVSSLAVYQIGSLFVS